MAVNADKPQRWKTDIARSVDYYSKPGSGPTPQEMRPGTFSFRLNVPVALKGKRRVNVRLWMWPSSR